MTSSNNPSPTADQQSHLVTDNSLSFSYQETLSNSLLSDTFPQLIQENRNLFLAFLEKQSSRQIRDVLQLLYDKICRRMKRREQFEKREKLRSGQASRLRGVHSRKDSSDSKASGSEDANYYHITREEYEKLLLHDVYAALETIDYKHEKDLFGAFNIITQSLDDFSQFYDLALSLKIPVRRIKFLYRARREVLMEFFGIILTSFQRIALRKEVEFRPFQCEGSCQGVYCWLPTIYRCRHCGRGSYCSQKCRNDDWTLHRIKCYQYTMDSVLKQQKEKQREQKEQLEQQQKKAQEQRTVRFKTYCNVFLFSLSVMLCLLVFHWIIFPEAYGDGARNAPTTNGTGSRTRVVTGSFGNYLSWKNLLSHQMMRLKRWWYMRQSAE